MPLHEALKEIDKAFYPDIAEAGSLNIAISKSLFDVGSNLVAEGTETNKFMPYARVEADSRFSQIYIAAGQRLFLFDFWFEGVMFGNASCENILDVAHSIHAWIADKSSIERMSTLFNFFSPTEGGKAYEAGIFVEHQWNNLLATWQRQESLFYKNKNLSPLPLIQAAMKKPELRRLFPFTSLNRLCFSRTTGYPFTQDCPIIEPQGNGKYSVYMSNPREIIGEGTVDDVMELAIKHLPKNCGAAVNGTADDFTNL